MAKKVVQSDSKGKAPVKKKRHGCRNCLITMLVIFVFVGVGVYFTGNYFTQRYLDMSLANCFGVLYDLRSANSKKIVTNSYGDKDYDSFNTELKKQLFLNDQADFGVETLLAALTAKEEGGSEAEVVNVSARNDYLSQSGRVGRKSEYKRLVRRIVRTVRARKSRPCSPARLRPYPS